MFSLSTVSYMDSFSLSNKHLHLFFLEEMFLHLSLASAVTLVKGGQKMQLKLAYRGGAVFAHVNAKPHVQVTAQTCHQELLPLLSQLHFHCLGSIFSVSPSPHGAKTATLGLLYIFLGSSPRENRKHSFNPRVKPKPWVWLDCSWDHISIATLVTVDREQHDPVNWGQVTQFSLTLGIEPYQKYLGWG